MAVTLPYQFDSSGVVSTILRGILGLLVLVVVPGIVYSLFVSHSAAAAVQLLLVAAVISLSAFAVLRRLRRRAEPFPHAAHPLALQDAATRALAEARSNGDTPPALHGELTVHLRVTAEGQVAELCVLAEPAVPASVRRVVEPALAAAVRKARGIPHAVTDSYFILRY